MKLIEHLPGFYQESVEMNALQAAMDPQSQALHNAREELFLQLDIASATWGLPLWENMFGLPPEQGRTPEDRRTRLMSKMRGQGTTTKEMIQNVAESFANGQVEVLEYPAESRFEVKFISSYGAPSNLEDLGQRLEEIKPAHLAYTFVFIYRQYRQLAHLTHEQLAQYTHNTLREGKIAEELSLG